MKTTTLRAALAFAAVAFAGVAQAEELPIEERLVGRGEAASIVRDYFKDLGFVSARGSRIQAFDLNRAEWDADRNVWTIDVAILSGVRRDRVSVIVDRVTGALSVAADDAERLGLEVAGDFAARS